MPRLADGSWLLDDRMLDPVYARDHMREAEWDPAQHPRGKTTPASTAGSFAPSVADEETEIGQLVLEAVDAPLYTSDGAFELESETPAQVRAVVDALGDLPEEHALMFTKDGQPLDGRLDGTKMSTVVPTDVRLLLKQTPGAIFVHNHPSLGEGVIAPLSANDLAFAADHNLSQVRAVGIATDDTGARYRVTYGFERPAKGWPRWPDVRDLANDLHNDAVTSLIVRIGRGAPDRRRKAARVLHAATRDIARRIGARYFRSVEKM